MTGKTLILSTALFLQFLFLGCSEDKKKVEDTNSTDSFSDGDADADAESDNDTDPDSAPPDMGNCIYECAGGLQCTLRGGALVDEMTCGDSLKVCCNLSGSDGDMDSDADADTDADADSDSDTPADGLDISKIAIYQGVEIPLMEDWSASVSSYAQVVQGKEALIRVFVTRQDSWSVRTVRAVLEMQGDGIASGTALSQDKSVSTDSSEDALSSTFNFDIPGEYLLGNFSYRISLVENGGSGSGNSDRSVWPKSGMAETGELSTNGTLQLVVVPVEYNADGSGRVPDTGEDMLSAVHNLFYTNYPIAYDDIEITVADVFSWDSPVEASGNGWDSLLEGIALYKNQMGSSAREYYFGLFVPASSIQSYCAAGCVAGLGYVPFNAGQGEAKAAIGLGFDPETTASTIIHEVGHNHGREHAPCGNVDGADAAFPYSGGKIGVWGYDLLFERLMDPDERTDFMGYCERRWVSDYTYGSIFSWIQETNTYAVKRGVESVWRSLYIGITGDIRIGQSFVLDTPPSGRLISVSLYDIDTNLVGETNGYFTPHEPLQGGMVLFTEPSEEVFYVSVNDRAPIAL